MTLQLKDPIREMYDKFKTEYRDTIMLAEDSDRYNAYYEDTAPVLKALGYEDQDIERNERVSIKREHLDIVLPRLVKKGYKIAICKITKQTKI